MYKVRKYYYQNKSFFPRFEKLTLLIFKTSSLSVFAKEVLVTVHSRTLLYRISLLMVKLELVIVF